MSNNISIYNFAEIMRLLSQLYVETSSLEPEEEFVSKTQKKIVDLIDHETRPEGESEITIRFEDKSTGAIREITMTMSSTEA